MKKAVIYCRVSTEEQKKYGFSIKTQIQACQEFAIHEGYFIAQTYIEEGKSAKDLNRTEVQKMIKYCDNAKNGINAIIVWRIDRLSRFNVDYHGVIRPMLLRHGILLLSATEINANTIEGDYMRNMMMCNAEYELSLIRYRTKENMKTIAQSGRMPCKAPIGYLNIKKNSNTGKINEIIIDEKNAPYIKRAFELYATGMYSYKNLGEELFKEGFRHPKTGEKYPARKLEHILHNKFYIGKFDWAGIEYEGTHTPIIDTKLFYRVQDMFKSIDKNKKHDVEFAYTGLIKCADCGCYYTAEFKRGKNKKGHYIYYHCSNSKNRHKKLKSYREEFFDNTFANVLNTICLGRKQIERLKILAKDYLKEFNSYEKNTRAEITKQINVLSDRIKKNYIAILENKIPAGISKEEAVLMNKEWQEEKDKLLIKLDNTNLSSKFIYNKIDELLKFSEMLPELFLKATTEEKKLIVTTLTKFIQFDGENVTIELKDTFKALQNIKKDYQTSLRNHNLRTHSNANITTKNGTLKVPNSNGAGDGDRTHEYRNHNPGP